MGKFLKTQFWPLLGYLIPKKRVLFGEFGYRTCQTTFQEFFFGRFEVGFGAPPKRQNFPASEK